MTLEESLVKQVGVGQWDAFQRQTFAFSSVIWGVWVPLSLGPQNSVEQNLQLRR